MTNLEYFYDDILEVCNKGPMAIENGKPVPCSEIICTRCDLLGKLGSCKTNFIQWLNSEHEDEVDWHSVKLDTKILVSNNGEIWHKRYFAAFENGKVYAWNNGATSWSEDVTSCWLYAKLDEKENYDPRCTLGDPKCIDNDYDLDRTTYISTQSKNDETYSNAVSTIKEFPYQQYIQEAPTKEKPKKRSFPMG